MTAINLSNITAANSTLQVMQAVNNDLMNGLFFTLALVALGIILFITASSRYMAAEAFIFVGFFISIIAGLLWLGGLVSFFVALIAIFLPMIGMFLFFLTK